MVVSTVEDHVVYLGVCLTRLILYATTRGIYDLIVRMVGLKLAKFSCAFIQNELYI